MSNLTNPILPNVDDQFIRSLLLTIFVLVVGHVWCPTWAQSESGGPKKKNSNMTNFRPRFLLGFY